MYLISPEKKQYKANLHCHSTYSDGTKTPEQLKAMYKEQGYSILAITDHEKAFNHSYLNDPEFITVTGYEAFMRDNPLCQGDPFKAEVHINLFARDPENVSIVWFDPNFARYSTPEEKEKAVKLGPFKPREFGVDAINEFVQAARENGYIASYNHPVWSRWDEENIKRCVGFFSMEMVNYSSYVFGGKNEYCGNLYERLAESGMRIFCHGADDNHNFAPDESTACDSFGGFTMIMPDEFTYGSIYEAMEKGEMYSSMGPVFKEISLEDGVLHIECSEVAMITVFCGSKNPGMKFPDVGKATLTSADIKIDSRAKFFRVSIVDDNGRFADTRNFFMDEFN